MCERVHAYSSKSFIEFCELVALWEESLTVTDWLCSRSLRTSNTVPQVLQEHGTVLAAGQIPRNKSNQPIN